MTAKERCPVCGFRIRGKNHENGPHHKHNKNYVTGAKLARKTAKINAHGKPTNVGDPDPKKGKKVS